MSGVKNISAILGLGAAYNWLKGKVNQCVDAYNTLSDKLADARKSTGLTQEEVETLNINLAKVNTRTAQTELLDLAYQAGKLGEKGEKDILKFVESADKIGVALGDDLGGKEEAINKMGKLVDLFKIKDEFGLGDGMLKIGSAVNALGAASTANEGYIVDFTSRIGGISAKSKIAITDSMGLAAAFDSLNAECEASATVVNKLIVGMFDKTSEYAKIAKMDIKSFSELLRTDANEALLSVLEGLNGADVGVTSKLLGEVGETGALAAQAVSLISSNIETVREQQALANEEFVKGTGIMDEFNIKNTTPAAEREKQIKRLQTVIVAIGAELSPMYNSFISGTATSAELLGKFINVLWQYKWALVAISGAVVVYNTYKKLSVFYSKTNRIAIVNETAAMLAHSLAVKAGTATTATFTLAQKAMAIILALTSGNLKAASLAAKAFFVSLGPVGWIITAIGALGGVIGVLVGQTDKLTKSREKLSEVQSDVEAVKTSIDAYENQRKKVLELIQTYNDLTSKTTRTDSENKQLRETIDLLAKTYPEAMKGVDNYGKAIDISTGKVYAAIEAERQFLMYKNKDIIDTTIEEAGGVAEGMTSTSADLADNSMVLNTVSSTGYKISRGGSAETKAKERQKELKMKQKLEEQILYGFIKELEKLQLNTNEIANRLTKETGMVFSEAAIDALKNRHEKLTTELENGSKTLSADGATSVNAVEKQKWTLESDKEFSKKRIEFKLKLLNNELQTEEQYNKLILTAEINTIEARISSNKEKGEDLIKLKETLLDKQNQQRKQEIADKKKHLALMNADDPVKQEEQRYEDSLREYGIFNKTWNEMTADQIGVDIKLLQEHEQKMSAIYTDALIKEFSKRDDLNQRAISQLKSEQAEKLASAKTFEEKKRLLSQYYSQEELRQITDTKKADKAIKEAFQKEELAKQKEHLESVVNSYQKLMHEFAASGTIAGKIATEEDKQRLIKIIDDLKAKLAELGLKMEVGIDLEPKASGVDVFGMTEEQWQAAFDNLGKGKEGLQSLGEIMSGIGNAIGQAFSAVSNLMTSMEQRELKEYEKSQTKKKQSLERRLKSGTISQEQYNKQAQEIDKQTDDKRVEIERKQAERQKMLAIFQAVVNTAVAVVNALSAGPIAGPILAAVVGALGAVQIAAIAAQPLPGAEEGGLMVERIQDGKQFNAKFKPDKRGAVDEPTVIVGENGTEYVVPKDGYSNPTVRPVLDVLETARKNGTLKNIDLVQHITPLVNGRQNGGSVNYTNDDLYQSFNSPTSHTVNDMELKLILKDNKDILTMLLQRLEKPINAISTVSGSNGSAKKISDYEKQKSNGYM